MGAGRASPAQDFGGTAAYDVPADWDPFVFHGLTAEMIVRTYHESQRKPIYIVREIISGKERDT